MIFDEFNPINYDSCPDWFMIDGVSSKQLNVWCDTPPIPPMAKQRYTSYSATSDSDVTYPDDSFEDISYKLTFFTFSDRPNYDNSKLYSTFLNISRLEISKYPDVYFKVRECELSAEQSYQGQKVKYTASMKLAPFKYYTDNSEIELASSGIVKNNGTRYCRPIIEIAGSGTFTFKVNGDVFTVTLADTGQYVVIDSERMITYDKTTGSIIQNAVTGLYPMLQVGENTVSYTTTSGVVYVKLTKNERCY